MKNFSVKIIIEINKLKKNEEINKKTPIQT